MSETRQLAEQFLDALASNSAASFESVLAAGAGLRLGRWDGVEANRPRDRVIERLRSEWAAWPDASLQTLSVLADGDHDAVEYRIQVTDPARGRTVEHIRSVFLKLAGGRSQMIDLYCLEPIPGAQRAGWIAPATLTDDEDE